MMTVDMDERRWEGPIYWRSFSTVELASCAVEIAADELGDLSAEQAKMINNLVERLLVEVDRRHASTARNAIVATLTYCVCGSLVSPRAGTYVDLFGHEHPHNFS